jgi:hypothetical protein
LVLLIAAVGWVPAPETRPVLDPLPEPLPSQADVELA